MSPPPTLPAPPALLEVRELCVAIRQERGLFGTAQRRTILDRVSLAVPAGATVGVVGESGSGKSTLARAILRLMPAHAGQILFDTADILTLTGDRLRAVRAQIQMIFQDPYSAMNPRHIVEEIVTEPLIVHRSSLTRSKRREIAASILEKCGMPPDSMDRYPHQFSGGQRQRIAIARALTLSPRLILCDEPTSALDLSVRAQIIELLMEIQRRDGVSYLFISHDMATIRQVASDVVVMKSGVVVESGPVATVFTNPREKYTQTLLDAVLRVPELAT